MNNIIKHIDIELYSPTPFEVIRAQQRDNKTRIIEFSLYDQGNPYTIPSNVTFKLEGHREDNTSFIKDNCCTVRDNKIIVTLDKDILYAHGIVEATIVMYDNTNDNILSTISFRINVQKNPCDKNGLEHDKKSLIDEIILSIKKIRQNFTEHIADNTRHITSAERTNWNDAYNKRHTHSNKTVLDNTTASYTTEEKNKLNGIQSGAEVNVKSDWNVSDTNSDAFIKNKPSVYTKNEIDNKFSTLETNIDWKESVETYTDIEKTYPNPQDGWTVNVKDTDYTYRYNGTNWVAISANATPKATNSVDGLLSKEDHANYDDANSKKHTHSNKTILDKITQTLLDNWDAAYSHISDTVKHITSAERTNWNTVSNKVDNAGDTMTGELFNTADSTDGRQTSISGKNFKLHMPLGGYAEGIEWLNTVKSVVASFGYYKDNYFYMGEAFNNPNGILKLGKVVGNLEGTATKAVNDVSNGSIFDNYFRRRDTIINNTTDWNSITDIGCYKVQIGNTWGNAVSLHSPNSYLSTIYSYGLLFVFAPIDDAENRLVQVYIPQPATGIVYKNKLIVYRFRNGTGWRDWMLLPNSGFDKDGNDITETYLKNSGGEVTGNLKLDKGYYVHTANGESGKNGYVKIAEIKNTGRYQNRSIMIEVNRRGGTANGEFTKLYIQFTNANSLDPELENFIYIGGNVQAYIYKSATSTWNLYIQKSEAYDTIVVTDYKGVTDSVPDIEWKNNGVVTSVPTGSVLARLGGMVNKAARLNVSGAIGSPTEPVYINGEGIPVKCDVLSSNCNSDTYAKKSIYGDYSVSIGRKADTEVGDGSFAFGNNVTASNFWSHAEGIFTTASGESSYAEGCNTAASNYSSHVSGKYNKAMTTGGNTNNQVGDVFVVGNGTPWGKSNALRVTYTGEILGTQAFKSSGADYAEHIKEWAHGNANNEDRVGYFVTIKDGFLYKANEGDYIAGITSGNPSVVGNADEDYYWKYERDEFNRIVMEDVPEIVQVKDEDGNLMFDEKTHKPVMEETGRVIKNVRNSHT